MVLSHQWASTESYQGEPSFKDARPHDADHPCMSAQRLYKISLHQRGEAPGAAPCQLHLRIPMNASCITIHVGGHGYCSCWCRRCACVLRLPPLHLGGLGLVQSGSGWSQVDEDIIGSVPCVLEESSSIMLHPWILEIIALLLSVRRCQRRQVVAAPLNVPFRLREGLRHLPFKILDKRSNGLFLCCFRRRDFGVALDDDFLRRWQR
mmetsp:Transcript_31862/g.85162  ORF Transcript_31862/g.85162 Transcript_31862/m.85162 type:complete len:207 (+) Transcript_31862:399-1019(+)